MRGGARWLLALFYGVAGVLHLLWPRPFLAITPPWVPWPEWVIAATGVAEIAGAMGLMVPRHRIGWARPAAGIGLALYAVCVWPANLHHALHGAAGALHDPGWLYHGPRLAAQPVLIWLALWAGELIDWPLARR